MLLLKRFVKVMLFLSSVLAVFTLGFFSWKLTHKDEDYSRPGIFDVEDASSLQEGVLVKVQDENISKQDVEFEYQLLTTGLSDNKDLTPIPAQSGNYQQQIEPLRQNILDTLIERKLLYKYIAQDKGFAPALTVWREKCEKSWMEKLKDVAIKEFLKTPRDKVRLQAKICEHVVIEQYLNDHLYTKINTPEPEKQEYYEQHKNEFMRPEMVEIRQIVVLREMQAREIQRSSTAKNFAQQVRRYSVGAEVEDGGKLGPFAKGRLPHFFDVAFTMREHEISPVIRSTFGFHIIILDKKYKAELLSYETAREKILKILLKKKQEKAYQNLIEEASTVVKVVI